MTFLNLSETERLLERANQYVVKELDSDAEPIKLTRREKNLVRQGLMVIHVDDAGPNYAAFSPNYPSVLQGGPTAPQALQNFYNAARLAERLDKKEQRLRKRR